MSPENPAGGVAATPLRALFIEDSADDAELIRRELERGGYAVEAHRVDTAAALEEHLEEGGWDIVFCDWSMPALSAPEALDAARRHRLDAPFILVSGTISDEAAVVALRNGAHDMFRKDRLALLVPAVERELRDAEMRREQARMQEQLSISERLAAVGMLAAGVAHEINNPLSVVLGTLELARRRLAELPAGAIDDEARSPILYELDSAAAAAARIRHVAGDLRVFARTDDDEQAPVDLERVVRSAVRLARTEIRHRARLRLDLDPVPAVWGNASRLGQVLLNLVMNAAQAIEEGRADENEIAVTTRLLGDRVVVAVSDTGSGIPAGDRPHLFVPFFTTKPPGVGTGLGLSICHRIVTAHGGTITVDSEVGKGSTFRIELAAIRDGAARPADAGEAEGALGMEPSVTAVPRGFDPTEVVPEARRRGRILVVDDEPAIGHLIRKVVERDHEVAITTGATEALDWLDDGRRYDLILCDLMMPDMTGMEFFERLTTLDREQAERTVFLTGGAFTERARTFLRTVSNPWVEKPFDIVDLQAMVNERIG